jgi:hypothetical protein
MRVVKARVKWDERKPREAPPSKKKPKSRTTTKNATSTTVKRRDKKFEASL